MADIWAPMQYGWSHVYWLQIEGIPIAWSVASTNTVPPSWASTESPTLVVGNSARIGAVLDRDTGIGAGFPLTFTLLDSLNLAALMVRPTAQTYLTGDLTSATGTANVYDTTDFAATGTCYVGKETCTFSAKTPTTLTLSARGVAGYAYPHDQRSTATLVTDVPRYWRGRFVTLYATPVDPTGFVTGTALDDDALVIWRGYLDGEPSRDKDGFVFEALPIDRILARPLAARITGKVKDTDMRFEIQDTQCMIWLEFLDAAGAHVGASPYKITFDAMASAAPGDFVSITEFNTSAIAAFAAAITTFNVAAYVNSMDIIQAAFTPADPTFGAFNKGDWIPYLRLAANNTYATIKHHAKWCGNLAEVPNALTPNDVVAVPAYGIAINQPMGINVSYAWSPYSLTNGYLGSGGSGVKTTLPMCAVEFDEGDPGALPVTGQIEIGSDVWTYAGIEQTTDAATAVFKSLSTVTATANISAIVGADVAILIQDPGTLADTARRMIHSSGEPGLRGAHDTLLGRVGYGLPEAFVDDTTIGEVLGDGWLALIGLLVSPDDTGLDGTLSGLLALSGRALVVTDDGSTDATLTAVYTRGGVSGWAAQLTDAHVLSAPASKVKTANIEAVNTIAIDLEIGSSEIAHINEVDVSRVAFEGARKATFSIPTTDKKKMIPIASAWGRAVLASDQSAAVLTIDVVPWLGVRVGDSVDITLTNPEIWNFVDATVGYSGLARCIGREIQLGTSQQRLHILIYGMTIGTALCPSAPVSAFAGTAIAPTSIDVPTGFWLEFNRALVANGANLRLLKYDPGMGAEGITEGYTISAATIIAGVCRLTVASIIGAPTLSTSTSYLTFAESANSDVYEDSFSHADDGTSWS